MKMYDYVGYYNREGATHEYHYNIELSNSEKIQFVSAFTDMIIGSSHLNLVVRDLLFDYMLMVMFTDVSISEELKEAVDSIAAIEDFLANCDVVDQMKSVLKEDLIDELNYAIDKDIEYKTGVEMNRLDDALTELVKTVKKKVNDLEVGGMVKELLSRTEPDKILDLYMKSDTFKAKQDAAEKKVKGKNKFKVVN